MGRSIQNPAPEALTRAELLEWAADRSDLYEALRELSEWLARHQDTPDFHERFGDVAGAIEEALALNSDLLEVEARRLRRRRVGPAEP